MRKRSLTLGAPERACYVVWLAGDAQRGCKQGDLCVQLRTLSGCARGAGAHVPAPG